MATPAGPGAVGILRLSGPAARRIAEALAGPLPAPRHAALRRLRAADGGVIDQGLVLHFPGPGSFTGEDVVEFQTHGSPVVLALLQQAALAQGARAARPGEFSERAFLAGRMDLTQAEAIADLIDASTEAAARAAARSLSGDFAAAVGALREALAGLRVGVESAIDFSEEDLPESDAQRLERELLDVLRRLDDTRAAAERGQALARGLEVVIVGRPNVGKSSLMNLLAGAERAIVSPLPGTTRDVLEAQIASRGLALRLIDTAGQRESDDPIEQEGVRRARLAMARADHVLLVTDASTPPGPEDLACLQGLAPAATVTLVRNKLDLTGETPARSRHADLEAISLSATTGAGRELLEARLLETTPQASEADAAALGARTRHVDALARAAADLEAALRELRCPQPALELLAERLRLADRALGEISGETTTEALLGRIFASFCIGK